MAPASVNSDGGARVWKVLGLTEELYNTVYKPIANKDVYTLMPLLLRPRSRGWVTLRNKNPFAPPLINANYFDDPFDIKTLVEGKQKLLSYLFIYWSFFGFLLRKKKQHIINNLSTIKIRIQFKKTVYA